MGTEYLLRENGREQNTERQIHLQIKSAATSVDGIKHKLITVKSLNCDRLLNDHVLNVTFGDGSKQRLKTLEALGVNS